MPIYKKSNGESIDKKKIDKLVVKAKREYVEEFIDKHGFLYCERTKRSDLALDCSHIISVRMCQASGRSELAWDKKNIELLNRDAHMSLENWSNKMREEWYWRRMEGMMFEEFKLFNKAEFD